MYSYVGWEIYQASRINLLSDRQVFEELKDVMTGHRYSWYAIAHTLQLRYCCKSLRLDHFQPGNILYEWNVLCDEKLSWRYNGYPSFMSFKFNRACLLNLKIIPNRVGLGFEALQMVEDNIDESFDLPINMNLTIGELDYMNNDERFGFGFEKEREEVSRLKFGYFYPEGPEFREDYIHERVEY